VSPFDVSRLIRIRLSAGRLRLNDVRHLSAAPEWLCTVQQSCVTGPPEGQPVLGLTNTFVAARRVGCRRRSHNTLKGTYANGSCAKQKPTADSRRPIADRRLRTAPTDAAQCNAQPGAGRSSARLTFDFNDGRHCKLCMNTFDGESQRDVRSVPFTVRCLHSTDRRFVLEIPASIEHMPGH